MTTSAADYVRDTGLSMTSGYIADCVVHACRIAELLLDEGRAPWIARLRRITILEDGSVLHEPLIARRFTGSAARTWNTHYVCCCDGEVLDPIAGAPLPIEKYSLGVFGVVVELHECFSVESTADLCRRGQLEGALRQRGTPKI